MKKLVLIVDDNAENLYLLHALLQGYGYQVITATNGADALDKAGQNPPDLVISDILMPVMDGFALCREWKKEERLKPIPFVFYTATYTDERDREFALSLGAEQFIIKPMEPEPFMAIIRETIQQFVNPPAERARQPAEAPTRPPIKASEEEESIYYKQYNAVLIRKLEDKMEQLEQANRELEEMVEERTGELRDALRRLVRQEKLAALGLLAGAVGHELRNPLGVIKNASYYLNMVLKDSAPGIKETLQILEREVVASERIISSLLDYAHPKSPIQEEVEIGDLLQKVLSETPILPNIEVSIQAEKALPNILADPDQLSQVFRNIIHNAVQAMPGGGKLVLAAKIASPGQIDVSISDTGIGIPKEDIEKIFEPLFTTKAKGIGLGLPITRLLVDAHKGSLLLQSEPGKGSVFTVRLPVGLGEVN